MINLVPETYSAPPAARRRYIWRTMAMLFVLIALFTGFYALGGEEGGSGPLNVAMMAVCIAFTAGSIYELVTLIRELDELQQRIHILAWAIGCGLAVTVTFLWGVATVLVGAPAFESMMAVVVAVPGYYLSLFFVSQSYR